MKVKISEYAKMHRCSVRTVWRRIKRGLFRSQNGRLINADLNAALNILKKEVGEFQYSIEVCSTPVVQVPERAYRSAK
jgi:transposase